MASGRGADEAAGGGKSRCRRVGEGRQRCRGMGEANCQWRAAPSAQRAINRQPFRRRPAPRTRRRRLLGQPGRVASASRPSPAYPSILLRTICRPRPWHAKLLSALHSSASPGASLDGFTMSAACLSARRAGFGRVSARRWNDCDRLRAISVLAKVLWYAAVPGHQEKTHSTVP